MLMDTLELEPKSSLDPILNHSTSSEASSITIRGNIGRISSLLENLSIENQTILSKCTNESIGNVKEQLNILRFGKTDRKATYDGNSIIYKNAEDLSFTNNDNFELSSELEDIVSLENSDLSILMKSRNSPISGKDIFKHLYKLNVQPLINLKGTLNNTPSNSTLSSQEKKKNSNNANSKRSSISSRKNSKCHSINQGDNSYSESNLDVVGQNESQENLIISSSFENEKSPEGYIKEKKTLFLNESNYNIKLYDKENSSRTDNIKNYNFSDLESRKKNILKNNLKHCELRLFDYLVEQETYKDRVIEKNELTDKIFNSAILNLTKEKESDTDNININNSINEKGQVRNNLMKNDQNRLIIGNEAFLYNLAINENKEKIEEFVNYFRKCNSVGYELNKSNLYQCPDNTLYEYNDKLSNMDKVIVEDNKDENDKLVNEKTKTKLVSNEKSTKKDEKNHNIYSKFGKCNKLKDVESIIGKITKTKKISDNNNDRIKDIKSIIACQINESDDSSNFENNATGDVSDRISSRLRKMHKSKLKFTKSKSLPKQITEEEIKKVIHKIALTSSSSKNNVKIKKEFKEKKSNTNRLRKFPQNMKYKNQTKTHVKISEMRKFLRFKLSSSSKTHALLDCEDIIEKVNIAIRHAQLKKNNINTIITTLQILLDEKNVCKNFIEFYTFISNFTPFSFQKKVMPLSGAFGCNGPKVTKKLSDPLR